MKKVIYTSEAPEPIGPYNQAILHKDVLYVSGQIAIDPKTGDLVQNDIRSETHQVMTNISKILSEAGMEFSDVLKCSIFIKNMNDFGEINQIYEKYFSNEPPARETVEVSKLPKNVNVEISCIASK
ncbi:MAG: RidA family protein [Bacteroidota bacterium]